MARFPRPSMECAIRIYGQVSFCENSTEVENNILSKCEQHTHIVSIFYGLIIMLLKVSILLNWLRIFAPMHQRNAVFWVAHVLIWSNVLFYGIGTIVEIFQCTPREKIWNPVYRGGSCPIDMAKHMVASLVINWVSDVAILILPQKVIWKLQVSRGQKVGLSLLFAIGLL